MIKIEEGKYYRTADGRKVGPFTVFDMAESEWALWTDGRNIYECVGAPREEAINTNIVAEWSDCTTINMGYDPGPFCADKLFPAVPARSEPKRETVTLVGFSHNNEWFFRENDARQNYRILFDLVDGKPDCDSIKMEKL